MILRVAGPGDLALLRHRDAQPHVIASAPDDDGHVYRLERDRWEA